METLHALTLPTSAIPAPASNPVLERIEQRLRKSSYRAIRDIGCEFQGGTAILTGRVGSYYAKQTAQELIRDVEGVVEIQNNLEVL